ncbi:hypothetical protein U9M48_025190 [Paspalum notatum var. saurae]|uniref:Uncharacterized protein n=1 Tax=Paspalum notatum var. saurae TaxID=547442 RepID=A0AAQ3WWX8_PASNO
MLDFVEGVNDASQLKILRRQRRWWRRRPRWRRSSCYWALSRWNRLAILFFVSWDLAGANDVDPIRDRWSDKWIASEKEEHGDPDPGSLICTFEILEQNFRNLSENDFSPAIVDKGQKEEIFFWRPLPPFSLPSGIGGDGEP